ncbi:hypothetical protein SAMN04488057_1286 [Cyclobacterium lianum]|uniref:Uncharacterized protein n=1 Tax=Cyclobacterium lianum TaxID=388280 RepID=A0A1M7QVM0_9BACT|nr:hypothetical protein [Cyclobacterium lianum]SHN35613.1 hypothetical protein SAMN04488057_1286 [Cyclobacterium lianum]
MKLDKKAFAIQSFEEAADHQKHYKNLSEEEKRDVFLHLMQAAYGFVGSDWPEMDKDYFEVRSLIKDGSTS